MCLTGISLLLALPLALRPSLSLAHGEQAGCKVSSWAANLSEPSGSTSRTPLRTCANGGIALLSWLLADPSPEVQQMSLMILGNLCSDSVDSDSKATKQMLLQSGGARAMLSCVHTEDPAVLLFACGALQNLCYEREWAEGKDERCRHRNG